MHEEHDVTVRQASVDDLDRLAPMFDAYRQFYRATGDLARAREFLRQRLEHHQSFVFLAEARDGSALGFTQLYPSFSSLSAARIFILNDLFVHPQARRKNVGSLLLAAAARFGLEAGAVRLTLSTEVDNLPAQALYESRGWKRQQGFFTYDLALPPL
jgi:ribosomal protein S18 acetylase RimI-like enzyme